MHVYFNETQGNIIVLAYHSKNYPLKKYNEDIIWKIYYA